MPRSSTRFASSPRFLRARHREPQAEQVRGGEQHAVRVDGDRSDAKQFWIHDRPPYPEHVEDHQRDADGNRGVGHVERPEVPRPASRSRRNPARSRTATRSMRLPAAPPMTNASPSRVSRCSGASMAHIQRQPDQSRGLQHGQHSGLEREIERVQQPERRAGVVDPRQAEEPWDHVMLS